MRTIKKVKFSGGKVQVDFIDDGDGATNELTMKSDNLPSPDLVGAMNELGAHACALCEMPESYADNCKVEGLSLSYTDDIMGAVITVQKPIETSDSPFTFNTPHMPAEPYGGSLDYSKCLPDDAVEAIEKVISEALEYIKGKRAQLALGL